VSIVSETASQPAPGLVSLNVVVCASDYMGTKSDTCKPINVVETHNYPYGIEIISDGTVDNGQMLVAFRVPDGSTAPATFLSDDSAASFAQSPSYTIQITSLFPPAAGKHWVGYISTVKPFDKTQPADRQTAFHAVFTLPRAADGSPFTGPFPWRVVVGFRALTSIADAANPVDDCSGVVFCADTPMTANIPTNLEAPVSDFGVLAGAPVTVLQGATATVSTPVHFTDGGGLGTQHLTVSAATDLPSTTATPSAASLDLVADSTTPIGVTVPVPASTPLGTYTVTTTVTGGAPTLVSRSNTAAITVVDRAAPDIRISTPSDGATYVQGAVVKADYACTDQTNASGVALCNGPVAPGAAIDTATLGSQTFRVDGADGAGNTATLARTYTVVAPVVPRLVITLNFNFTARATSTRFTSLVMNSVPTGSTVTVTCRPPGGKPCPLKRFTKQQAKGTVRIRPFSGRTFRVGTVIDVRVTRPGTVGAVKLLTIRRNRAPSVATRCLPPGAKGPSRC
jgi:hypothetical protein